MYNAFDFGDVLESPAKAARRVEDVLPVGAWPGFSRRPIPDFDEGAAISDRGLNARTAVATGTSKRAPVAALGARHSDPIRFPATPAVPSIAARGPGKPAVAALH